MTFSIQANNPVGAALASAEDASLDEAVESAFRMEEEDALLEWNGASFSLNYKYDLGMMLDDLLTVLERMRAAAEGALTIGWASSSFPFSWSIRWTPRSVELSAQARDPEFGLAISGRETLSTSLASFFAAWQPVLQIIEARLTAAGYTSAQLARLPLLHAIAHGPLP